MTIDILQSHALKVQGYFGKDQATELRRRVYVQSLTGLRDRISEARGFKAYRREEAQS